MKKHVVSPGVMTVQRFPSTARARPALGWVGGWRRGRGGKALTWPRKPSSGSGLQDSSLPAFLARPSHSPGLTSSLPGTLKLKGAENQGRTDERGSSQHRGRRETQCLCWKGGKDISQCSPLVLWKMKQRPREGKGLLEVTQ